MEAILLDFTELLNKRLQTFIHSFSKGYQSTGSQLHLIKFQQLNIMDCLGCTEDVFFVPNGECKCIDDLSEIYPKLKNSQTWVFALDISKNETFQKFPKVLNRLEPMFPTVLNGLTSSPQKKILSLLFSKTNDGNISSLLDVFNEFSTLYNYNFLGCVHRTNYDILELIPERIINSFGFEDDYFNLASELAAKGSLNKFLQERLQRPIIQEEFLLRDILNLIK